MLIDCRSISREQKYRNFCSTICLYFRGAISKMPASNFSYYECKSTNQQIILQYCNEEETYTDGNDTVHTLRREDTVKVSPTSGKMYRPA